MAFARKRYMTLTFENRHRFYRESADTRHKLPGLSKVWGGSIADNPLILPDALTVDTTLITADSTTVTADQTRN